MTFLRATSRKVVLPDELLQRVEKAVACLQFLSFYVLYHFVKIMVSLVIGVVSLVAADSILSLCFFVNLTRIISKTDMDMHE